MQRALFLAVVLMPFVAASVSAANLSLKFTNMSGDSVNELAATPKGAAEASSQNILAAPIANGGEGVASFDAAEGECVFNLTFTFASGKVLERPDTDLCQTDSIIVE